MITSLSELFYRFRRFISLVQMKKVISISYGSSTSNQKPWRQVRLDLIFTVRDTYIYFNKVSAKYFFPDFKVFKVSFSIFGCFSRFFCKIFACFQGSSKNFHQISTYKFRNFSTNFNIGRFLDTKMGDLSRFDTCINANK